MAIRIRIYPQPGSIGLRRRRAVQQQRQQIQQQRLQLQYQQQLLRQQQVQQAGFGGYGFGTQSGYGFGGFGGANYGASYASPSVGQYSYGTQSPFASSWGVTQSSPYGAYAPVSTGYGFGSGFGSGFGFGASPFLGASYLGASAYAAC